MHGIGIIDLGNWMMVFVRSSAMLAVLPFFSTHNFPVFIRLALSGFLGFMVAPLLPALDLEQHSFASLIYLMIKETGVGLLLGFSCRLLFFALEMAGSMISTEMGLMLSGSFNPLNNSMVAAPGMLLFWMAGMLMLALDLHHWIIVGFQTSYQVVPVGGAHLSESLMLEGVRRTSQVFVIAMQITAPIIAVSFLITLIFSLLGRAVPQMNVFSESFPVRTLVGLTVFGMSCGLMSQYIVVYLRKIPEDWSRIAQFLGQG